MYTGKEEGENAGRTGGLDSSVFPHPLTANTTTPSRLLRAGPFYGPEAAVADGAAEHCGAEVS